MCLRLDLAHKLFKALDLPLEFAARFTVRLLVFILMVLLVCCAYPSKKTFWLSGTSGAFSTVGERLADFESVPDD